MQFIREVSITKKEGFLVGDTCVLVTWKQMEPHVVQFEHAEITLYQYIKGCYFVTCFYVYEKS